MAVGTSNLMAWLSVPVPPECTESYPSPDLQATARLTQETHKEMRCSARTPGGKQGLSDAPKASMHSLLSPRSLPHVPTRTRSLVLSFYLNLVWALAEAVDKSSRIDARKF